MAFTLSMYNNARIFHAPTKASLFTHVAEELKNLPLSSVSR
ncbi:hypothetical protein [Candidatus Liberibacter sp.]|nr:hypothetical protein [Candidatus Liberibacter sp.]